MWLLSITVPCMQPAPTCVMNKSHKKFESNQIPPLQCGNRNGRYLRLVSRSFLLTLYCNNCVSWLVNNLPYSLEVEHTHKCVLVYELLQVWFPWNPVTATGMVGSWRKDRYSLVICDCRACKREERKRMGRHDLRMLENLYSDWLKWKQRWLKQKRTPKYQFRVSRLNLL